MTKSKKKILDLFQQNKGLGYRPSKIMELLELKRAITYKCLKELLEEKKIQKTPRKYYIEGLSLRSRRVYDKGVKFHYYGIFII